MSLLPERPSLFSSRSSNGTGRIYSDIHHRVGSSSLRSKPYSKPSNLGPPPPRPPALDSDSRWCHDLFEDDSSLYGPKVRFQVKSPDLFSFAPPAKPSPSLRPFGSATSISTSAPSKPPPSNSSSIINPTPSIPAQLVAPTNPTPTSRTITNHQHSPSVPITQSTSNSGLSLLSRIQINAKHPNQKPALFNHHKNPHPNEDPNLRATNQLTPNHSLNQRPNHAPQAQHQIRIQTQNSKIQQQAFDAAMAKYLAGPVILEVANLADGTSPEDVKTAFADFGEIQECITEEGARQANQPTLKAKIIFTHKAEAEKAVEALNGALADGLTLAVKIIGRPTKKPERADFMITNSNPPKPHDPVARSTMKHLPLYQEPQSSSHVDQDVVMGDAESAAPVIVPTGRLRSEVVAQCDPRASIQVEPKPAPVYQLQQPLPAKPASRNMLSRVQPLTSDPSSFQSFSNNNRNHTSFGNHQLTPNRSPAPLFNPRHHNDSSKSLLARIKPN